MTLRGQGNNKCTVVVWTACVSPSLVNVVPPCFYSVFVATLGMCL